MPDETGRINDTHNKGFKVLLSVLGGAGDAKPSNFPSYAALSANWPRRGRMPSKSGTKKTLTASGRTARSTRPRTRSY